MVKQRDYENELRQIRNKWVDAGKPGLGEDRDNSEDADSQRKRILGGK